MALPLPDDDSRFIAVTTTGIFCRRGCPAPAPLPTHVERLATARHAVFAGYRACLRCRPLEADGVAFTDAELRRAERMRPILAAARRTRRTRSAAATVVVTMLQTPLGPMLAGATEDGICLLEFTDRPMLPTQLQVLDTVSAGRSLPGATRTWNGWQRSSTSTSRSGGPRST